MPAAPLHRARLYLAALWAGSAIMVAISASMLNAVLTDRVLFGQTVSGLFKAEAWIALGCALAIHVLAGMDKALDKKRRRMMFVLTVVGLVAVLGYFFIQPMLAELRAGAGPGGVMASAARQQFGMLHGVSLGLYLVQAVAAVVLVVKNR